MAKFICQHRRFIGLSVIIECESINTVMPVLLSTVDSRYCEKKRTTIINVTEVNL